MVPMVWEGKWNWLMCIFHKNNNYQFGLSDYEDFIGALMKLWQSSLVNEY